MKPDLDTLKAALLKVSGAPLKKRLTRLVPQLHLKPNPDWLFTSGKPNRYNPAGVECIYFSESPETARAEYESGWTSQILADQPVTTFHATADLRCVLDVSDPATLRQLGLKRSDLTAPWRLAGSPTLTQLLGQAVSETGLFSAIRYPSAVKKGGRSAGMNVVIFKDCVQAPDGVEVRGDTATPLQKWS